MSKSVTTPAHGAPADTTRRTQQPKKTGNGTKKQIPARLSTQSRGNAARTAPAHRRSAGAGANATTPRRDGSLGAFRRRHPVLTGLMPILVVVLAVGTMVAIKASGGPGAAPSASRLGAPSSSRTTDAVNATLPPSVLASLNVPTATLDAVGSPGSVIPPSRVGGDGAVLLGTDGKPVITYIGAEYCPYCAAERWALAVALSRFGTFTNLSGTHSASDDVYPDTQTLSFYGSSYSSAYVDFQSVEEATNQRSGATYQSLQSPSTAESKLLSEYDPAGSIPFVDIANKYIITGASFSPQVLQGLSRTQIAAQLRDSWSPVAQAVDGTANDITAAISTLTGDQPSSVASSPAIAAIAKRLGA